MQVFIYCKFTLHVSGVHRTYHQEHKTVNAASGTGHGNSATTFLQRGLIRTPNYLLNYLLTYLLTYLLHGAESFLRN